MTETATDSPEITETTKRDIYLEAKKGKSLNELSKSHNLSNIEIAEIINQFKPKGPGQPPAFNSPKEMQERIDKYFEYCENKLIIKQVVNKGTIILVPTPTPVTMAGLALWLGIHRETLNNYDKRSEYFGIVSRARKIIEESNITMGMVGVYERSTNNLNLASNFNYSTKDKLTIDIDEQLQAVLRALPEKYAIQVQAALVSLASQKKLPG